jgi:hypothetical protein
MATPCSIVLPFEFTQLVMNQKRYSKWKDPRNLYPFFFWFGLCIIIFHKTITDSVQFINKMVLNKISAEIVFFLVYKYFF